MATYALAVAVALLTCIASLAPPCCLGQNTSCNTLATQNVPKILPCQGYVTNGNSTTPGSECCIPLTQVVTDVGDECFCTFVSSLQTFAASIPTLNQTRAMELLTLCKITPPPQAATCLAASNGTTSTTAPTASASGPSAGVSVTNSSNAAPAPVSHAQHTVPSSYAIFSLSILALCLHSLAH